MTRRLPISRFDATRGRTHDVQRRRNRLLKRWRRERARRVEER